MRECWSCRGGGGALKREFLGEMGLNILVLVLCLWCSKEGKEIEDDLGAFAFTWKF